MKKRNIILVIAIVIIVALLGYFVYLKFLKKPDEITVFLEELKANVELDFSEATDTEFNWSTADKELLIKGKAVEVKSVADKEYLKVEDYFNKQAFEQDNYNVVLGPLKRESGFKKGEMVCLFTVELCEECLDEDSAIIDNKNDLRVECGFLNAGTSISSKEALEYLFKEKYNNIELEINITEEKGDYARGEIGFKDGFGGIFLAFNNNGHWQIVYDGNGVIPCEQVEEYDFPEDMAQDCSYIQTMEVEQGEKFPISFYIDILSSYVWALGFLEEEHISFSPEDVSFTQDPNTNQAEQVYQFTALEPGETKIKFLYTCCNAEKIPLEERVYKIIIK